MSRGEPWAGQATIGARALGPGDVRGMPHGVGRRVEALGHATTVIGPERKRNFKNDTKTSQNRLIMRLTKQEDIK